MLRAVLKALKIIPQEFKRRLIILQVILVFSAFFELLGVASIGPFIALAINPGRAHEEFYFKALYSWLGVGSVEQFVATVGVLFCIIFVLTNIILLATQVYLHKVSGELQTILADKIYKYFLYKDYQYHLEHRPGELISKINNDVVRLSTGFILSCLQVNSRFFSILLLVSLLFVVNHAAAISMGIVILGAYICVYIFANSKLKSNGKKRSVNDSLRNKMLYDSFNGVKTIQFYHLQNKYSLSLKENFVNKKNITVSNKVLHDLPYYLVESVAFVVIVCVVLYVFANLANPELAVAQLSVICLAGYRLIPKFQQVYRSVASIKSNQHSLNQLYEDILEANQSIKIQRAQETKDSANPFRKYGELELKNINFRFREDKPLIELVNLKVKIGEVVGITGASGSGKSTLMSIISGMLAASSGKVYYDGVCIDESNKYFWRKCIGYVDSETYIFNCSLAENIILGREYDREKLNRVIGLAGIVNMFDTKDVDFEVNLMAHGGKLSSGQRQRIGIARALYGNPHVLLMDEATNALDYESQQSVISAIKSNNLNLSIVVISHRLDMRDNFDRVFDMSGHNLRLSEV